MKKWLAILIATFLPFLAFRVDAVSDSARAAIVINGNTGQTIYEHDADKYLPMASTTKIMTALLLCEAGMPETLIRATSEMVTVEGSAMGLQAGDLVTYRSLLYGMLLSSGNDAANATAIALAGSTEKFVERMNARAADLGLYYTHFDTPSGLDGETHYTTARDLAKLARYAMQNETFATAAASPFETVYFGDPMVPHTLKNHHRLVREWDGTVGVKTGFTKKAGRCLVTAVKSDGKYAICVTLHDGNDWEDHKRLLTDALSKIPPYKAPCRKKRTNPIPLAFPDDFSYFHRFRGIFIEMISYF